LRPFCRRTRHESLANTRASTRRGVTREWGGKRQVGNHCAASIELGTAFFAALDVRDDGVPLGAVEEIEDKRVEISECFVVSHG